MVDFVICNFCHFLGESDTCVASNVPNIDCNCDSNDPTWYNDQGIITSMDKLPITAFSYGPLELEIERANVTIGRLKCQGNISRARAEN